LGSGSFRKRRRKATPTSINSAREIKDNPSVHENCRGVMLYGMLSCLFTTKFRTKSEKFFEESIYRHEKVIRKLASQYGVDLLCTFRRKELTYYVVEEENSEQKSKFMNKYESSKVIIEAAGGKVCRVITSENEDLLLVCRESIHHSHPVA
jgi:hypothetical protein